MNTPIKDFLGSSLFGLFLVLIASSQAIASPTIKQIENVNLLPKGCFVSFSQNDQALLKCLSDANKLARIQISESIKKVTERDRIRLLNTKGLYTQILLGDCEHMQLSEISKQNCKSQAYISYLDYIQQRYLKP